MAFCFFFVSIFSILFGNENSTVGVVVLLCLMVFRNADLGIHTGPVSYTHLIDLDTFEEKFVSVPEQGGGKLIPDGISNPGQRCV